MKVRRWWSSRTSWIVTEIAAIIRLLVDCRDEWKHCRSVAYSAATDEGRGALDDHLMHAAKRFNPPLIGKGRLAVMRELQRRREEDRERAAEDKQHRTLTFAAFKTLCETTGGISDPVQFLHFLHNAGQVFWQETSLSEPGHSRSGLGAGCRLQRFPSGELLRLSQTPSRPFHEKRSRRVALGRAGLQPRRAGALFVLHGVLRHLFHASSRFKRRRGRLYRPRSSAGGLGG